MCLHRSVHFLVPMPQKYWTVRAHVIDVNGEEFPCGRISSLGALGGDWIWVFESVVVAAGVVVVLARPHLIIVVKRELPSARTRSLPSARYHPIISRFLNNNLFRIFLSRNHYPTHISIEGISRDGEEHPGPRPEKSLRRRLLSRSWFRTFLSARLNICASILPSFSQ